MLAGLAQEFRTRYGRRPEIAARAPGRVNLIGEHTDYNQGLVLPCAVDRDTVVLGAPRSDGRVRVFSRERAEEQGFELSGLRRRGDWVDYVQGVFFALREEGRAPPGFDVAIASEIPLESGLSSSAALGLALVTAVDLGGGLGLAAEERARIAHRGESKFVGVGCGVMDQLASGLGRRGVALRIDCRAVEVTPIPLPVSELRLLIHHSGQRRSLAAAKGGYGERRDECRRAVAAARAAGALSPGGDSLRDLLPGCLSDLEGVLDPVLFRRLRHVVTENRRVEATCAALGTGDLEAVGALLCEGMRSLREDFEASTPELDSLCELADGLPGVYGSRLTGAGFGGCTLHLVKPESEEAVLRSVAEGFERRFGRRPPALSLETADGAGPLPL